MSTRAKILKDQLVVTQCQGAVRCVGAPNHCPGGHTNLPKMWTDVDSQEADCWGQQVPRA
eukprot:1976399-Karenia_brevis.AAC.1